MSEVMGKEKFGVCWWHVTSCATICPESCLQLGGVPLSFCDQKPLLVTLVQAHKALSNLFCSLNLDT